MPVERVAKSLKRFGRTQEAKGLVYLIGDFWEANLRCGDFLFCDIDAVKNALDCVRERTRKNAGRLGRADKRVKI